MLFRLTWIGLFLGAIAVAMISLVIEARVFTHLIEPLWAALTLAIGLESLKVLTILLSHLDAEDEAIERRSTAWISVGFRAGLLVLSALATVIALSIELDRPALEAVRSSDLDSLRLSQQRERNALLASQQAERERLFIGLEADQSRQMAETLDLHRERIRTLEDQLTNEMAIRDATGNFEGRRWRSLEKRLAQAKADLNHTQTELSTRLQAARNDALTALGARHQQAISQLDQRHRGEITRLREADYLGDERVENPTARAFVSTLRAVTGSDLNSLQFGFGFALFLAILMETAIFVGFAYLGDKFQLAFGLQQIRWQQRRAVDEQIQAYREASDQDIRAAHDEVRRVA